MNRKLVALLCVMTMIMGLIPVAYGSEMKLSLNPNTWFDKTVDKAAKYLEDQGYIASDDNKNGLLSDMVWKFTGKNMAPYNVNLYYDSDTREISWVIYQFDPDPELFSKIYESLTMLCGEPAFAEEREDKQERVTITYPEAYAWRDVAERYNIVSSGKANGDLGTIDDIKKGKTGFSLRIFRPKDKAEETAKPTATLKPTATPKPVKLEVSIASVKIKDTNYGTREFYIQFKNNADQTVDRIDFQVQGFNRYGELIEEYNINTVEFYLDEEIGAGKTSPKNIYYTYYMLNEATKIKVAIVKYHMKNGRTVTVPEYQYKWETFEKN